MTTVVTYECPIAGNEHAVPGDEVRILKVGDAGFTVACDCGPEPLSEADEEPHPTVDHLVNIYGKDPSPEDWLALEDAADGWYATTRWHSPEGYDGTNGQRRRDFRESVEGYADTSGRFDATPSAREVRAREVACPSCEADAEQKCNRPSGHRVRKPHADRVEAAVDAGVLEPESPEVEATEQGDLARWAQ